MRASLEDYAALLAGAGVERGLIGPREVPRLWTRHLLNCAVVAPLVAEGASVVDVGSGAGLPGLVWAIVRPDLRVTCVEPLLRRATFLEESVAALGLGERVSIVRARAEEVPRSGSGLRGDVVTARAVAPLDRLASWAVPLVAPGGELLALKGRTALDEVEAARATLERLGVREVEVVECGQGIVDPATTVVRAVRA
ncbi:MAG: 16S rRNA (guanine(527)-N(7))-methyltransferase RsmG [bacterium]